MKIIYTITTIVGWIAALAVPTGIMGKISFHTAEFLGLSIAVSILALLAYVVLSLFTRDFWKTAGVEIENGELLRRATIRCRKCHLKVSGLDKNCPYCTADISSSSFMEILNDKNLKVA